MCKICIYILSQSNISLGDFKTLRIGHSAGRWWRSIPGLRGYCAAPRLGGRGPPTALPRQKGNRERRRARLSPAEGSTTLRKL